jgi:quinol monooxygenase YgiN
MELVVFARFHVRADHAGAAAQALRAMTESSRAEAGCLEIQAFGSTRDPRLFYIHSRWRDEAAFELHARLPHTMRFLDRMDELIDQPREVTRTRPLGEGDRM